MAVVVYFSHTSQHNVVEDREQTFLFPEACDQLVCVLKNLLIVVLDQLSVSRLACQAVKIGQDFHKLQDDHFACTVVFLVYQIAIY